MESIKTIPSSKIILNLIAWAMQKTNDFSIDYWHLLYDLKHWPSAYRQGGHAYVSELKKIKNKKVARKTVYNLKQKGYIKTHQAGEKLLITLTDKGKRVTLSERLKLAKLLPYHTYTIVIFDIPETENFVRRRFRWLLKQSDFVKLQQSVWASPRDVFSIMINFIKELKLEKWVNVFQTSTIFKLPNKDN